MILTNDELRSQLTSLLETLNGLLKLELGELTLKLELLLADDLLEALPLEQRDLLEQRLGKLDLNALSNLLNSLGTLRSDLGSLLLSPAMPALAE